MLKPSRKRWTKAVAIAAVFAGLGLTLAAKDASAGHSHRSRYGGSYGSSYGYRSCEPTRAYSHRDYSHHHHSYRDYGGRDYGRRDHSHRDYGYRDYGRRDYGYRDYDRSGGYRGDRNCR